MAKMRQMIRNIIIKVQEAAQLLAFMNLNGPSFTVSIYIVGHRLAAEKEDFIPLQNNGNVKRNMMNVFCRVSNPATQCS